MRCTIYMGARDAAAQPQAVKKMRLFGAKLEIVDDADRALSSATSAAIRHWMGHSDTDAYVAGAPIGPHPYPEMVAAFQQVIGKETRLQLVEVASCPPPCSRLSAAAHPPSGSSPPSSPIHRSVDRCRSRRIGRDRRTEFGAALARPARHIPWRRNARSGRCGGQILAANSIAPGLAYPGSAPQLADLVSRGRVETMTATDIEAQRAVRRLAETEGVLICLEAGHALAAAEHLARTMEPHEAVVVMTPSSGDKDIDILWQDK